MSILNYPKPSPVMFMPVDSGWGAETAELGLRVARHFDKHRQFEESKKNADEMIVKPFARTCLD